MLIYQGLICLQVSADYVPPPPKMVRMGQLPTVSGFESNRAAGVPGSGTEGPEESETMLEQDALSQQVRTIKI